MLLGVLAIGRNEGKRLSACLESLKPLDCLMVYVDSGSSDGSVERARSFGAEIVELDMSIPFSAARARNAGFEHLLALNPDLHYVQFVDGDCVLDERWLPQAIEFLSNNDDFAVVCGRRRERFPDASIYNRLIDMEWNTPIGLTKACGGDALFRVSAFQQVHGFNPSLIAGEEPELCVRLRQKDWKVMRLNIQMTLHDADMHRFVQWWRRATRGGFAYAQGSFMHGRPPERHWVRETRSALVWGLAVPVLILSLALLSRGWGLFLLSIYPLQVARIALGRIRNNDSPSDAWLYGLFCVLAKFPEVAGVIKFYRQRLFELQSRIIEYK